MVSLRAETLDVAEFAAGLAPSDPQAHYALAVIYDRTLLADDQQRSLKEYETAVALSPHNYLLWVEYGKALGRAGEAEKAEAALRRAQELAPHYSSVQWALGNLLIRNNKVDEGFSEIRSAVEGDRTYAAPAAAFAYQYFDGDLTRVRGVTAASAETNASLALLLAGEKRLDDAVTVWQSIDHSGDDENMAAAGRSLVAGLISAKRFGLAMQLGSSQDTETRAKPETLFDGNFEEDIKLEGASDWDWRFSPGAQPQPLQTTAGPHSGTKSLLLRFASNDGASLRQLSQTVVVKSESAYSLNGYYRSEMKTSSRLVWQVLNAADGSVLAETPINSETTQWTPFTVAFTVPGSLDGVVVRFIVNGCGSAICPINGNLWFDDLTIASAH